MPLPPRTAWTVTLVATATMAVSYVDRQAVAALAPTITADLGISETAFGWLGSAFSIAYLVGAPVAGRVIDRVGARRGLTASVLVWSAVAAAHALVPGFATLFLLRILLGLAEAPSFPGAAQTVTRALPPARRAAGFGVLFTGSSIGAALSAVIAPTLAGWWGWRPALVGTALVGLLWLPLWLWVTHPAATRAALATPDPPDRAEPPAWGSLFRRAAVWRALAAVVATAPVVGLILQYGAKLLVAQHGITQLEVREYLWVPPLAFDAGAVVFGVLGSMFARRHGDDPPTPRALFATAAVLSLAVGGLAFTTTPWQTTCMAAIALAGGGGVYALATSDMLSRVPPSQVAAAGGLTAAAQSLALIIAFPTIGSVVQSTILTSPATSYHPVVLALAAWMVPGALFWLLVPPGRR